MVVGVAIAVALVLVITLIDGGDDPVGVAAGIAVAALVGAVAHLPLRFRDGRFRVAAVLMGSVLLVAGVIGLVVAIGVLLLPLALVYLGVALAPASWSARRTLTMSLGIPAAIVFVIAVVAALVPG